MSYEFHKTLERVVNEDLRRTLETLFSKVVCQTNETTQPEVTETLRLLRTLLERGFREIVSYVTTSCDYLIAAGSLDYGDANLSPVAEKLFTQNFASMSSHEPMPAF